MLTKIAVVFLYLFAVAYLGYKGWKHTRTAADYMVAGRQVHSYVMAMSYGATFISTSAIIGFGGAAGVFGMSILWLTFLNIFLGVFVAFVFLGKRTRRMGRSLDCHTFPEILGKRFQSRLIQGFSGIIIFLFMPLYAAVVLIGISRYIEVNLGIPYHVSVFAFSLILASYVIWGGLKGVMYTDALQGTIMFAMMVVLLIYTYSLVGGVAAGHEALTDLAGEAAKVFAGKGHLGWTKMPALGSAYWWVLVSTIVFGVGIGVLAQPQLAVRFMTVRSDRELNRGVLVGGIFILAMTGVAFTVGSLTNVVFFRDIGRISLLATLEVSPEPNIDQIIPLYITKYLPGWFGLLFLLAMLAASMSTMSSQFHAGGTSLGRDFFQKGLGLGGKESGDNTVYITRLGVAFSILFTVVLGIVLPVSFIARGTAIFFGLCGASFLPAFIGALYFRGMTRSAAISSIFAGFAASALWMLFVHRAESGPLMLCNLLFGRPTLGSYPWVVVDTQWVALPISTVVAVVVSLLTKGMDEEHLRRCFPPRPAVAYGQGQASQQQGMPIQGR